MATAKKKPTPETTADDQQVVMLASIHLPLEKLTPWAGNVRKTESTKGIDEMAASILAHGLIQSLVVREVEQGADKGKFEVITGRRRYTALAQLREQGKIPDDYKVPCQVMDKNASADEIGLAENTVRVEMNAADQFEAFQRLTEEGKSVTDIAHAFGVSETVVNKRLKLANSSSVTLDGYRSGILTLSQLEAFSVATSKKAQEKLFLHDEAGKKIENLHRYWALDGKWNEKNPKWIRDSLTAKDIRADDKRVLFVGVEEYEAAGGKTRRDLFVDDIFGIYILDEKLLDKLVQEKLQQLTAEVKAEGWQWVNASGNELPYQYSLSSKYEIAQPRSRKPGADAQKTIDDLKEKIKLLQKEYGDVDRGGFIDEEAYPDASAQEDILESQIKKLQEDAAVYAKTTLAIGGAMIGLDDTGTPRIMRGLIEKKDAAKAAKEKKKATKAKGKTGKGDDQKAASDNTIAENDELSKDVLRDLSIHRTFAIGATLAGNPEAGLASLLHPMVLKVFYDAGLHVSETPVRIDHVETNLPPVVDGFPSDTNTNDDSFPVKGFAQLQRAKEKWLDKMPEDEEEVWQYLLGLKLVDLVDLAALLAGLATRDIDQHGKSGDDATRIMQKFNIDMAQWYTPGVDNLFGRLNKAQLASVIRDIRGEPLTAEEQKLKKNDLADMASGEAQKRRDTTPDNPWLPHVLRTPEAPAETEEGAGE